MVMDTVVKQMSIDELRSLLAPAEDLKWRTLDPKSDDAAFVMGVDGEGKSVMRFKNPYSQDGNLLDAHAYIRFCQMVGIPGAYARKTPHPIMLPHVNYWMKNSALTHFSFAVEGDVVRLFSRGTETPVANTIVIDAIGEVFGPQLQVCHVHHDMQRTCFSIVSEDRTAEAREGEAIRIGVTVENSYSGIFPLTLSTYTHTLWCTNGAVSADSTYRYSRKGHGDDTEDWVRQAVQSASDMADLEIDKMRRALDIKLDAPHLSETLASVYGEYGVPVNSRQGITDMVVDRGTDSLYDLVAVITDIASNGPLLEDPRASHQLMQIGGRLLSHPDFCPSCHRTMN